VRRVFLLLLEPLDPLDPPEERFTLHDTEPEPPDPLAPEPLEAPELLPEVRRMDMLDARREEPPELEPPDTEPEPEVESELTPELEDEPPRRELRRELRRSLRLALRLVWYTQRPLEPLADESPEELLVSKTQRPPRPFFCSFLAFLNICFTCFLVVVVKTHRPRRVSPLVASVSGCQT